MSNARPQGMNVPAYVQEKAVDEKGYFTEQWQQFFSQMQQYIAGNLGVEGYSIPPVSSAANSVTPAATGGQLAQVQGQQDQFGTQIVQPGTTVFDPAEVNGGSSSAPNGQLKVLLADGTFHKITNS